MKFITIQRKPTLQLETATIFEIVCNPAGSCPAKIGLAGCADIVTFTFFTQGSATTTSLAFCSNCYNQIGHITSKSFKSEIFSAINQKNKKKSKAFLVLNLSISLRKMV